MKREKTEKGITLVALIVTIIVLLILAAVTIGAIQNDGIIEHAKNAREQYGKAQTNEKTTLEGYLEKINENDPATIEAKKDAEELDLMERYALGTEKTGRLLTDVANLDSNYQITSFNDEEETINDASTIIPLYTSLGEDSTKAIGYVKYNNKVYKIVADFTTFMTEEVEMVYKPEGREGQKVKYDSDGKNGPEDWIIITDRGGKVEIVSADVMYGENNTGLTLGSGDTTVTVTSDLDGDEDTTDDLEDRAIASYNKAITTINNYCKNLVTAETDKTKIRSIGLSEESEEIEEGYSSTNYNSWFENSANVKVRKGDTNFEKDLAKLYYHGIANVGEYYWVASRLVYEISDRVDFLVRDVDSYGFFGDGLWFVGSDGYVRNHNPSRGVRPVVINPSGI